MEGGQIYKQFYSHPPIGTNDHRKAVSVIVWIPFVHKPKMNGNERKWTEMNITISAVQVNGGNVVLITKNNPPQRHREDCFIKKRPPQYLCGE